MTSFRSDFIHCPVCQSFMEVHTLASTNSLGGQATDFRLIPHGADPIALEIATCGKCGFSDYAQGFIKSGVITKEVKRNISEEITPIVKDNRVEAFASYEFAAKIAIWRKKKVSHIANLYLRAAWCAEDEKNEAIGRSHRTSAIEYFKKALDTKKLPAQERLAITYLIGELYRRVHDPTQSAIWFNRAIDEGRASKSKNAKFIIEVAEQQRDHPREKFGE